MNKQTLFTFAGIAVLAGALGAYVGTRHQPAPTAAASAPADAHPAGHLAGATGTPVETLFAETMNDPAGKVQALAQWKGKPLVVNFWAPWCPPCVEEMPELADLAREHSAKNINVIGIGIDSPTNIAEFATKFKITYPIYVAGINGTELSRKFGNNAGGLPYTVLIGADGLVKKTYLGRIKFDELKADLAALKS
ncbi:TlpA family protein disulfide reductase [Massilia antarctica]|uniref:TlpA family protein disulfide reductase n=1 Tax=Massilia antarctica TaxID=2765360 RepID=UPI0006BB56E6|nr:TlpA disulfide reductase family protein [Massilia sp. H27-R4]MCY0913553.1 TlpA disulfide reductase family protein [Massilia sp. H27-R4]CUI09702.1 Cytochrome c-type biogenesis protein ResA [Janthinobacterium sp. CG23_2]CUU33488.1 Cytochrome c-type biogenesis protein ResA [Janthinobacterium sp. CG23_2]